MQTVPSWDLFLAIFFIVSIGYSFVLQREKVVVTLLAIYTGIVIAWILSPTIGQFFVGDKTIGNQLFIKANASSFSIQAGIFILTTVLVSVRSGMGRGSSRGALSNFELAIFSFLNSALILTAIFSFMAPEARTQFAEASRIGRVFINQQVWWHIAPIIALVVTGGIGKGSSRDY